MKELSLGLGVRLHIPTLVEYDGRGQCVQVDCYDDGSNQDNYVDKMWRQMKARGLCWVGEKN